MSEVLAVEAVSRRFGPRRVVAAATVAVHAGRIVALLGRNGCGKTTVLRIACGALPADGGHVRVLGRVVARPRLHRLATQGVFLLPERGLLAANLTVRDHFDRVVARWGGDPAPALGLLRLAPLLDRYPAQLSSGERRRAEFALALVRRPAVLLADEPFQGVAPVDAELLAGALRRLRAGGCGMLVTGHEVENLLAIADEVVWMSAGITHALGAPGAALTHHSFRSDYLGPLRGRHHG